MLHLDAPQHVARRVTTSAPAPAGLPSDRGTGPDGWLLRASVMAALLPVVVATVRAVGRGWLPVGDNAYFAIRARDVLTEHHPLLGTWTSASITAGTNFNNPGPLLFDLLAAPAKLLPGAGVAVGAALLNGAAIVGIAVVARRRGGALVASLAMVVTAVLCWSMGSELLFDPWQPHSLLLTSLLLSLLAWSLAAGDVVVLPWLVAVASLLVQTHLSYAVLVAAQCLVGVVGLAVVLRRARRRSPTAWPALRRSAARAAAAATVVLAVCWAQPLVEEVTGEGVGNLSRLASSAGSSPETVGPGLGARLVARVLATPPWFARPSFAEALRPSEQAAEIVPGIHLPDLPSGATAAWSLGAVGAVLAALGLRAARRGDRAGATAVVTAAVAVAAGLVTATSLPVGFLGIAPHQFRWLWPLAAFTLLALAAAAAGGLAGSRRGTAVTAAATGLVLVVAAANLPVHDVGAGPADDAWAIPVVRELNEAMAVLEGEGPLVIDMRGIRFAEPYSGPVMAELQRRGIPFVVDDEGMVRQLGPSRRADADDPRLLIREGDATQATPPGQRRAVLVEGLDEAEQAELAVVRAEVAAELVALGRVPLNERGRAALADGDLPVLAGAPGPGTVDPEALFASRELALLVERDLLDLDGGRRTLFERYATLQRTWDHETVALFVAPPDPGSPRS